MYEEYNAIRRQAEMDGYILDDDTFEYLVQYAKRKAEIAGGVILILIGLKILLEHLGIIAF